MKKHFLFLAIISSLFSLNTFTQTTDNVFPELKWVSDVGAKIIPSGKDLFRVNKYGAINDGKTLNTKAIQSAIDDCWKKGGGVVVFDTGAYLTGSLFIKKGVNLLIGENVVLLGSQNITDYPEIDTRIAGIEIRWPAALINILNEESAAVSGKGIVYAQGKPFWDKYWAMRTEYDAKGLRWIIDYDCKRPRTLLIQGSSQITVSNITLRQAGFWTVQVLYSDHVTVDGIVIQNNVGGSGPSTDGIDIDSSTRILVENCDIDCNDDDFCFKAGRDADGLRVNRPTEYVVIRNCVARKGGGLITFGSETSGGIRNVLAYNLIANGTTNCINFKSAITRGGTVENIYIHDIEMNNVGSMLRASMDWNPSYSYSSLPAGYSFDSIPVHWKVILQKVSPERGLPHFRNVFLNNLKGTVRGSAFAVTANQESLAENFSLTGIEADALSSGKISFARGWKLKDVNIKAKDGSKPDFQNCLDIDKQ